MSARRLNTYPIHLGRGGAASAEPVFVPAPDWYADYDARHAPDGPEGRLVSEHRFTESWSSWECHPSGAEIVCCLSGRLALHQEQAGGEIMTTILLPGDYAINQPGVWHTADVEGDARAMFITAGAGTLHRPR